MFTETQISKVLVANRGEIARRIFRTCRAMGIATVAIFSDADAGEAFVDEADEAVRIGGASPSESYLRSDAVIEAARRMGADAIHPGYGFLSENAGFARACADADITFIGPRPDAIARMGSKLEAKLLLKDAGVPVLEDVDVTTLADDELTAAADALGYPLLLKPSAGGGGKGMRVVRAADELLAAVAASRREAMSAFGDDTMLLERFVEHGRHVEIQILGDLHGNVVHLNERECSVQRRHQKVLEEAPSVAVDPALRAQMGDAAVRAGRAIDYCSAGTVEFLLADDGSFFFLEVNTRLQVEHPVTEAVTGLDLVRLQIEVATGAALPASLRQPSITGHAIEVRLYAEDPASGFLPQTGRVERLRLPAHPAVRVDAGVGEGGQVTVHYDPMIAKIIAHAPTRPEAARILADVLRHAEIDGLTTNRDFLVRLLTAPRFLAGQIDTRYLDREEAAGLRDALVDGSDHDLSAAAAALARQERSRASATVCSTIPSGFRNHYSQPQQLELATGGGSLVVRYGFRRGTCVELAVDERELSHVRVEHVTAERVVFEVASVRRVYRVRHHEDRIEVNGPTGQTGFEVRPRLAEPSSDRAPGSLVAPMPGRVIRVDHRIGDLVELGQPLVVVEAMKMEHEICAPLSGTLVELPVGVGTQVDAGTLLAAIEAGIAAAD